MCCWTYYLSSAGLNCPAGFPTVLKSLCEVAEFRDITNLCCNGGPKPPVEGDTSSLPFDRFIEGWFSVQQSLSSYLDKGLPNLQGYQLILQNTYRIELLFA
jgi:hypothetical protein